MARILRVRGRVLDPGGFRAAATLNLWWFMLALGLGVYVATMGTLAVALVARRGTQRTRNAILIVGGIAVPGVILIVLIAGDLATLVPVSAAPQPPDQTVEVVGHQFWWEVRYPDHGISTANEIHIPSNARVLFKLTSTDVIHSFWIPSLAGKTDLNPGLTTTTWLEADAPGEYRGQCAEFCGTSHANMELRVFADNDFQGWVAEQQQPAHPPGTDVEAQGAQAFASLGCITCHALRYGGSAAVGGGVGPDLTHLASRHTIAAGILPNNPETLMRWIADPKALKPGVTMPATNADAPTLQALATYLAGLR